MTGEINFIYLQELIDWPLEFSLQVSKDAHGFSPDFFGVFPVETFYFVWISWHTVYKRGQYIQGLALLAIWRTLFYCQTVKIFLL